MYPVSSQYIEKINTSNISDRQISGTIKLLNGQTIQLTNDILSGGSLTIDNSCESGSDFQLGSAYIGQLSFSIFGDYSRYAFYQADNGGIINLTYTLIDNIPLGTYTIMSFLFASSVPHCSIIQSIIDKIEPFVLLVLIDFFNFAILSYALIVMFLPFLVHS